MKTKAKKSVTSLKKFLQKEIKQPEAIQGGARGPIGRDRMKTPQSR